MRRRRGACSSSSKKDAFEKHQIANLNQLNTELIVEDSYKEGSCQTRATLYVINQVGLKHLQARITSNKYFAGVPRIPRTVLDAHREGLILGQLVKKVKCLKSFCPREWMMR